jgi:hypothetical protein
MRRRDLDKRAAHQVLEAVGLCNVRNVGVEHDGRDLEIKIAYR